MIKKFVYSIVLFVLFSPLKADKVYKTYEDYLAGKAYMEGAIDDFWTSDAAKLTIKTSDGKKVKVSLEEIWGFEHAVNINEALKPTLHRVFNGRAYSLVSKAKLNCWVVPCLRMMPLQGTGIYTHYSNCPGNYPNQGGFGYPWCFYSTDINSDLIKINSIKTLWELVTPEEKAAIEAEMKRTKLAGEAYYGLQFLAKLFPLK